MKMITKLKNSALASGVLLLSTPALASAEGGTGTGTGSNSGRGFFELLTDIKQLGSLFGETSYIWAIALGVCFFAIGAVIWGTSSNQQGGNQTTKKTAVGFMIAGFLLGSIGGIMGMGSQTLTKQDTEITGFMGE